MVLHAQVCGRVGRRPVNFVKALPYQEGFLFLRALFYNSARLPLALACVIVGARLIASANPAECVCERRLLGTRLCSLPDWPLSNSLWRIK